MWRKVPNRGCNINGQGQFVRPSSYSLLSFLVSISYIMSYRCLFTNCLKSRARSATIYHDLQSVQRAESIDVNKSLTDTRDLQLLTDKRKLRNGFSWIIVRPRFDFSGSSVAAVNTRLYLDHVHLFTCTDSTWTENLRAHRSMRESST